MTVVSTKMAKPVQLIEAVSEVEQVLEESQTTNHSVLLLGERTVLRTF